MSKIINILSLFDGMSCGQIAATELGWRFNYFAAEIDKHATAQTSLNFPNTTHIGDVTKVNVKELPKIDLLIGGSPCQGFSFAGKMLNFADPRSALFFEYVRILNDIRKINTNVKFLLENVNMKKEHLRVISEYLGVYPVRINSNLVSAQNRDRWYWTNIKTKKVGFFDEIHSDIPQPADRGIFLKDILQPAEEVNEKYFVSSKALTRALNNNYSEFKIEPEKTSALNTRNNAPQMSIDSGTSFIKVSKDLIIKESQNKASCLTGGGHSGGNHSDMDLIYTKRVIQLNQSTESNGVQPYQQNRVYDVNGISQALNTGNNTNGLILDNNTQLRRLTVRECSRLQTVPEWYVWQCSDTQAYKMLGNGWTVEVIKHILSFYDYDQH